MIVVKVRLHPIATTPDSAPAMA